MVRSLRSLTLFITHYQHLSRMARSYPDHALRNVHMRFTESPAKEPGSDEEITFLYEVADGVAHRSYGLNVARLANLPGAVLDLAREKSKELEGSIRRKRLDALVRAVGGVLQGNGGGDAGEGLLDRLVAGAEQL
jgi:DNA mismatch repair protein MSH3